MLQRPSSSSPPAVTVGAVPDERAPLVPLVLALLVLPACDYGLRLGDDPSTGGDGLAPASDVVINDPRDGVHLEISWRASPSTSTVRVLRAIGKDPGSSRDATAVAVYEGDEGAFVDTLDGVALGSEVHYGVFAVQGEDAAAGAFAKEELSAFLAPTELRVV